MSSYIADKKTMDRMLSFFANLGGSGLLEGSLKSEIVRILGREWNLLLRSPTKLGNKLYRMNEKAVDYRYNEKNNPTLYEFTDLGKISPAQAAKSIDNFTYQCFEGTVPKMKLYKQMEKVATAIKVWIVDNSPEYEKAEWG